MLGGWRRGNSGSEEGRKKRREELWERRSIKPRTLVVVKKKGKGLQLLLLLNSKQGIFSTFLTTALVRSSHPFDRGKKSENKYCT